ncbi:MAG: DNA cytosine methyltransferase [Chloroflexota bacterium]|nr:DNA cytosine methyltransferase [Chloroflexota bacterium]
MSTKTQSSPEKTLPVKSFLFREREVEADIRLPAVSLFAGGGLSDLGYELAGFEFIVHAEKDKNRATLCAENFPDAESIVGELQDAWETVVQKYLERRPNDRLALLSVTPPCQGMSHSNPDRGRRSEGQKRDDRNRLTLKAVPVIEILKPRVVVVENVPQLLTEPNGIVKGGKEQSVVEAFAERLPKYSLFGRVVQMADYGVAQDRRRAIVVAVCEDEEWARRLLSAGVGPWPVPTHDRKPTDGLLPWVTAEEWFKAMGYEQLDAKSEDSARDPGDPLHVVSVYEGDYYWRVADIPPKSGLSAYDNSNCRECGRKDVPKDLAKCSYCGAIMHNRPYVVEADGTVRLIKGRHSSYRRMRHDEPARTITTASSHVGSDYKVHPWENRVLSIRECADLQTVPRFYDWSWALKTRHTYLARVVIGEALPPWSTYLQGQLLGRLLNGEEVPVEAFAPFRWAREALTGDATSERR